MNRDVSALGIVANGNGAKQNGEDGAQQIECQRINAEGFKETRPRDISSSR